MRVLIMAATTSPVPTTTGSPSTEAAMRAHLEPIAMESGNCWILPPEPRSVAWARRLTRTVLTEGGAMPPIVDDAMLIVSELVTNALAHAVPPVTFRLIPTPRGMRGEIIDHGPLTMVVPGQAGCAATCGRGLSLVDTLADRWGVDLAPERGCKTVWFEIATSLQGTAVPQPLPAGVRP
jgi:anti-sigma regulatory factor (Ser/Thr protein kinase)